jgi:two-component system, NtrC family, sensor kinase
VNDLLSLTRAQDMEPVPLELLEIVEETIVLVGAQAAAQGVSVERGYGDEKLELHGDPRQLRQVFLNIALNSLQAMPQGGRLLVEARSWRPALSESAPRWAEVTISDTGHGIPPDHLEKVFDPFFTTKREGTGLGLSTCYWIVQRHEGEMDLRSEPGQGTSVTIKLPLGRCGSP